MSKKNSTGGSSPTSPVGASSFIQASLGGWRNRKKFGKVYTEFKISAASGPLCWALYRRYNEFCDLHKQLQQQFPTTRLPTLPGSKLFGRLDKDFLNKRKTDLAEYLRLLLCHDQLSNSAALLVFLGAMSHVHDPATPVSNLPYQLHIDKIVEIAHHGDVVLFHTAGVLQSVQRSVTGSNYDHVGIILRTPIHSKNPLSLYILEATSDGVKKYPFVRRLRAWSISNATIVYRQLTMDRSESNFEPLQRFSDFADSVDGKPYGISAATLFKATLTAQAKKPETKQPERGVIRPLDISPTGMVTAMTSAVMSIVGGGGEAAEKKDAEDLDRSQGKSGNHSPTNSSSPTSNSRGLEGSRGKGTRDLLKPTLDRKSTEEDSHDEKKDKQPSPLQVQQPQPLQSSETGSPRENKENKDLKSGVSSSNGPHDTQRQYFCSELVASCYQILGLVSNDVSASEYLPSSFAEEGNTPLKNGAKLGREILIIFKKPEVETAVDSADVDEDEEGGGGLETSKRHKVINKSGCSIGRECEISTLCGFRDKGHSPPLSPLTSPLLPEQSKHHRIRSRSKSLEFSLSDTTNSRSSPGRNSESWLSSNDIPSSPTINEELDSPSPLSPTSAFPFPPSSSPSSSFSSSSSSSPSVSPLSSSSSSSSSSFASSSSPSLLSTGSPSLSPIIRSPSPLPPLPTAARPLSKSNGSKSSSSSSTTSAQNSSSPIPLNRSTSTPHPTTSSIEKNTHSPTLSPIPSPIKSPRRLPVFSTSSTPLASSSPSSVSNSSPLITSTSIASFLSNSSELELNEESYVDTRSRSKAPMYHMLGQITPTATGPSNPNNTHNNNSTAIHTSPTGTRANRTFTTGAGILVLD